MSIIYPLGIVRSLGEENIRPLGIIIRSKKKVLSASKYFKKIYFVENVEEGYELLKELFVKTETSDEKKRFILTSDDTITSFLDKKYDELKDYFIFYNAGECGRISEYMDKNLLCQLASKCGLKIPKTYLVKTGTVPKDIEYPVITKAKDSVQYGWKENVYICNSEEELKTAFSKIQQDEIIIQQYIKKKNELCIDGICVNRGREVFLSIASTYNYLRTR